MIEQNLAKLGFSPSEIKVYFNLLRKGNGYANKISSETGLNRTNVYEALNRLVAKGVISRVTKNKVKWFEAKSPDSILAFVSEKESDLQKTKQELSHGITQLKKSLAPKKEGLEASIFVGRKGLRSLFEEILEENKPISVLASKYQFKSLFGVYFENWHKKRVEKGIKQRSIFPESFKKTLPKRKLLQYRFVDNRFTSPTTTILCGNLCLLIQWSKEPIAVKIQNKDLVKSHQNYFNMLWNTG